VTNGFLPSDDPFKSGESGIEVRYFDSCIFKKNYTDSKTGRVISIHDQEAMLQDLKYFIETSEGRAQARERVKVEHALASIRNRKGPRARYIGSRLNDYDLNRTAMLSNLHVALRLSAQF
jgi:hypothetical protein